MTEHSGLTALGGILLFVGLLGIITVYSAIASGMLSHSFAQNAISEIINYTLSNNLNSQINVNNLSNAVSTQLSSVINQPNCGTLCMVSSAIKDSTGINLPLNGNYVNYYSWIVDALTAAGVVLIVLGYRSFSAMMAIGRNAVSVGIMSFVTTFVPIVFIIPTFATFTVSGFTVGVPYSVLQPFASALLNAEIAVGVAGAVLMIVSYILNRMKKNPKQATTGTKLIVTQR